MGGVLATYLSYIWCYIRVFIQEKNFWTVQKIRSTGLYKLYHQHSAALYIEQISCAKCTRRLRDLSGIQTEWICILYVNIVSYMCRTNTRIYGCAVWLQHNHNTDYGFIPISCFILQEKITYYESNFTDDIFLKVHLDKRYSTVKFIILVVWKKLIVPWSYIWLI